MDHMLHLASNPFAGPMGAGLALARHIGACVIAVHHAVGAVICHATARGDAKPGRKLAFADAAGACVGLLAMVRIFSDDDEVRRRVYIDDNNRDCSSFVR